MEFFTNKQNIILENNTAELLKKHQELTGSTFTIGWIYSCILSCHAILDYLLFKDEPNFFNKNINILNQQKIFEIIKLLVSNHLSAFIVNIKNKTSIKEFEEIVFCFFSFNSEDKKTFKDLNEDFNSGNSKYFGRLYIKVLEKGYGKFNEYDNFMIESLTLAEITTNAYKEVFMKTLKEKLNTPTEIC